MSIFISVHDAGPWALIASGFVCRLSTTSGPRRFLTSNCELSRDIRQAGLFHIEGGSGCTSGTETVQCNIRTSLQLKNGGKGMGWVLREDGEETVRVVGGNGGLVRAGVFLEESGVSCRKGVRLGDREGWWDVVGEDKVGGVKKKNARGTLWKVEIECASVGQRWQDGMCDKDVIENEFIEWEEGWVLGLLVVGVRGRLRSCHGKVLEVGEGVESDSSKEDEQFIPILQGKEQKRIGESSEREAVFDFVRRGRVGKTATYCLLETGRRGHLHVDSEKSIQGSVLSLTQDSEKGIVEIGIREGGEISLAGPRSKFVMAGPFGKLEVRNHCRGWERWRIEVVKQALEASLTHIKVSSSWSDAEAADRMRRRLEISRRVAEARGESLGGKDSHKAKISKGFDYGRAVNGISEPSRSKPKSKTHSGKQQKSVWVPKSASGKSGKKLTGATPVDRMGSKVPRSKSARRRARKKAKKAAASKAPAVTPSSSNDSSKKAGELTDKESATKENISSRGSKAKVVSKTVQKNDGTSASTSSGPPCSACGHPLFGQYTKALGKQWHPTCFRCRICQKPMGVNRGGEFRTKNGIPYCESCYVTKVAERCAKCGKAIPGEVVTAMEKTWHKECLTCVVCKLPLTKTFWIYAHKPREPRCSRCHIGDESYDGSHLIRWRRRMPSGGGGKNQAPTLGATVGQVRFFGS